MRLSTIITAATRRCRAMRLVVFVTLSLQLVGVVHGFTTSSSSSTRSLFALQSSAPPQEEDATATAAPVAAIDEDDDEKIIAPILTNNKEEDDQSNNNTNNKKRRRKKKKYQRKRAKPKSELKADKLRRDRQERYEELMQKKNTEETDIWRFEMLFPEPVWDESSIQRDLYEVAERDKKIVNGGVLTPSTTTRSTTKKKTPSSVKKANAPKASSSSPIGATTTTTPTKTPNTVRAKKNRWGDTKLATGTTGKRSKTTDALTKATNAATALNNNNNNNATTTTMIDVDMTQRVEGAVYGIRRTAESSGDYYDTSLMGQGAVQFRNGVRLGNPLKVNADRLTFMAKKELAHGRMEEAQELYESALELDPRDGRAYLGLSRIAEKRRDFALARQALKSGISNSISLRRDGEADFGGNPFLLQALGCLEEKAGHLAQAEALYISAAKSRPSHAASWVALAQLRTRKLRQTAAAGRICFQTAERELTKAGLPPSSHVYTAWAALEYKKADNARRARELFSLALGIDKKCSAAYLQLGVMEANLEKWEAAQDCFDQVLKFDKRNSRVLQAYALMESKRPDGNSRKAIGLFEKALKAKPRDAGVLQAYALFVARLGDIDAARELLQRGTKVNKRHAPLWQAWGVLEFRYGTPKDARDIFQQGIWACSQLSGGQSGGYKCARLWQAWGVLEAAEGDYAAARRCWSRALDADTRNVATITAWTLMEEDLNNERDAVSIFERALKQFPPGSEEKISLWRAYELMEQRLGNLQQAQNVYQRSMRETMTMDEEVFQDKSPNKATAVETTEQVLKKTEVEVSRWGDSLGGEVWMNDGSIEAKMPKSALNKKNRAANTMRSSDE